MRWQRLENHSFIRGGERGRRRIGPHRYWSGPAGVLCGSFSRCDSGHCHQVSGDDSEDHHASESVCRVRRKKEEIVEGFKRMGGEFRHRKSSGRGGGSGKSESSYGVMAPRKNIAAGSLLMPSIRRKTSTVRASYDHGDGAVDEVRITKVSSQCLTLHTSAISCVCRWRRF